jgi:hypothetical protein
LFGDAEVAPLEDREAGQAIFFFLSRLCCLSGEVTPPLGFKTVGVAAGGPGELLERRPSAANLPLATGADGRESWETDHRIGVYG